MKNLTLDDFTRGVLTIKNGEINHVAPLGFSGDSLVLDGTRRNEEGRRESFVSMRNHSDDAELLITDKKGRFLTLQKYGLLLDADYIALKFYEAWCELKEFIEVDMNDDVKTVFSKDAHLSIGFKILELAHSAIEPNESA